jgi:serine protease Do
LGVGVREIDAERAKILKLREEYGVEITRVEEESPASKAGLKVGDAVMEYNGQRVEGTEQFVRFVRETPVGRTAKLLVIRNGGSLTLPATIGSRKNKPMVLAPFEGSEWKMDMPAPELMMPDIPKAMMSWRSPIFGIEAESLGNSQLADFFGVKEGVLVRSVMKGSAAEKAGVRAGDVLLKVDDSKVLAPRDVTAAYRSARTAGKKSIVVALLREKRESSITVELEEDAAPSPAPGAKRIKTPQTR